MPGPPVWHVCAHPPSLGQIMVWRESSWAAHYQSPLPASDTLFTEAPGADSPGRRQPTQGTALPSPHTPALSLLGLANSWAQTGLHCPLGQFRWTPLGGYPPSYPSMPPIPKVQPSGKEPLKFSTVSQPHKLLPWRRALGPGASSRNSPTLGAEGKQGDTGTLGAFSSFPPCRLHPWAPAGEAVSDPSVVIFNEWGQGRMVGTNRLACQ